MSSSKDGKTKASRFRKILTYLRRHKKRFIAGLLVIAHIAGGLSSVEAIMRNRTPQGAVAWALSLNLFPLVAVPVYWTFGHSEFEGYTIARRSNKKKFEPVKQLFGNSLRRDKLVAEQTDKLGKTLVALADMSFTNGNHVELLIDGEDTYASMLEAIEGAGNYILFQFYIVRDDDIGTRFKEALIEKAKEGVEVRVIYDEIGSIMLDDQFDRDLQAAGADVYPFTTTQGDGRKFQINFRNHRKILIVDGEVGFTGGFNIGDEYLGKDKTRSPWRDTHMRVTGPAVISMQVPFAEDWYWVSNEPLSDLNWRPSLSEVGDIHILSLPSGPADYVDTCGLAFASAIHSADKRLWIATPYFVPDEQITTALKLAALRGVDVRIIIPEKTDSKLIQSASFSYLTEMEAVGIRTFRHQKGFMHQKVMLIDDAFSMIGSANMDNRSFRLNFEITLAIRDASFAGKVQKMLMDDLEDSREVKAASYLKKPFHFQLASRITRLLAPIL